MKTNRDGTFRLVVYAALILSIIGNAIAISALLHVENLDSIVVGEETSGVTYTASGALFAPPTSLASAPVIAALAPAGSRLTGINSPFSADELAVINNANDSYFETGGMMYINGSLQDAIIATPTASNLLEVNGKPTVIYLGAISCIYCGENRWAMALALSRFGNFSSLFEGYSSFGDGDVPTIYWRPDDYNATSGVDIGNFYSSDLINFISIDYASPITGGFQMGTLSYIADTISELGNQPYDTAIQMVTVENNFVGTPYTIWGRYSVPEADALVLGNSSTSETLPNMTQAQVLRQLAVPSDQFAWSEYAGADFYMSLMCATLNNKAPICNLPIIADLEARVPVQR